MKESRSLWNEDELLSQLEEAQDYIEQLQDDNDNLSRAFEIKKQELTELKQTSSSEISKLQSALQQAQKKIQEQRDQIVKLNGADLILKDNEKLKSENERIVNENAKLVSENDRVMKEAALTVEAGKLQIQKKEEELQVQINAAREAEARASEKESTVDAIIKSREHLVRMETAAQMIETEFRCRIETERRCQKESDRRLNDYRREWEDDRIHLTRIIIIAGLYSLALTAAQIIQWIF